MGDPVRVVGVDLGAGSGRVVVAEVTAAGDELAVEEVHRFPTRTLQHEGLLCWDAEDLRAQVLAGLRAAARVGRVDSVGIDSWAVDYGLLDGHGALLGPPVSYRDSRTDGVMEQVLERVPAEDFYATTGLQFLPFNTVFQLVVEQRQAPARLAQAARLLLLPDLLGYQLTGQVGAEVTNASTTQLLDVRTRTWARPLAEKVGVPHRILPPLRRPGDRVGTLLPEVADATGLPATTPVTAVGSHDTASAVVGVPLTPGQPAAYISSGTWSLVGLELPEPVLTDAARRANFTNEGGVDGTVRFLRNVSGLWVLDELLRAAGQQEELAELLQRAATVEGPVPVVDVDAPEFLPPGDMAPRIAEQCRRTGQAPPEDLVTTVRAVLESLALAYRRTVREAAALAGRPVEVVHVVGGGSRNRLLCQLTADACGLPVVAGPVEGTALGNVLVQARALGADLPDLAAMRALIRATEPLVRYQPAGTQQRWRDLEDRLTG
ncbi:rhamnulokinase [Ornithinicoccus halotolerans]|uniref:rhamnulokinase n=1 Tax=Ornithinicoccus halotolerans TaxID=1748220 RepID=UPI001294F7DE|nr:rhamnulokinase family protein [Ornithinicoccus halotolerans]